VKTTVLGPGEITADQRLLWSGYARQHSLGSPFLSWAFVDVIGRVRHDVRVALVEDAGTVGYFPFQTDSGGTGSDGRGSPVGAGISDAQAFIAPRPWTFDPRRLLAGAGLTRWAFDHLVVEQDPFAPYHRTRHRAPVVDLGEGYESFTGRLRSHSRDFLPQVLRRRRKLEREVGPVTFEWSAGDVAGAMGALRTWKSQQYRRTGVWDRFARPWIAEAMDRLSGVSDPDCTGVLGVLRTGDRLAAVHLGLLSADRLCWWFPAYDPELGRYSPGLILLLDLIAEGAARRVPVLDLGRGEHDYKLRVADRFYEVAEGEVTSGES
jgi:CelD/BcsL family acetyltransferase involved in cellulose biosynthesis